MPHPPEHDLHAPFGHPGIPPRWTSSAKDGVVTAYSTASRVWITLSHGIVNEVYYPTIDRPQIRDLQFLITDGETFFHEEKRDLQPEVACLPCADGATLSYRIVNTDPDGRYRIVKEIIADPYQPCVLIHARLEASKGWKNRLQLYVLLAPHLGGSGWGNSARAFQSAGQRLLVAWKGQTCLALGANVGFSRTSCGYVGYSDGWQDLHDDFYLDWEFERVEDGNIAVIGQIDLTRAVEVTLGLAFGDHVHAAVTTLAQSLSMPFNQHRRKFLDQWQKAARHLCDLSAHTGDGGRLHRISHNLLLAHEDKTYTGARIASASIPWGNAKGDEDAGGYHLVWTRDMAHGATALLICGETENPRRALIYLACSQQRDGGFPQNFWLDGTPYWKGIQLDEVAFPILLAWRLWKTEGLGDFDPYPMVKAAAAFLIRQGPATQQERWEETSGYSPSTLAASIAALICAADFARARRDVEIAVFLEEYADFLESRVERWTVTTQGDLVPDISTHYIRILPKAVDDPSPEEDPNTALLTLNNRPPGTPWQFPAKDIVDAGFLELVRYGVRGAHDPLIEASLKVVDAVLKVKTPFGPCWRRYNHDGYGDRPDGGPFLGWGQGRAWPLLTGERGHYEIAAGRDPRPYILAMEGFASCGGMLPEQVWDEERPELGMALGRPAGSAMPLVWAHAEYLKLVYSASEGRVFDLIAPVAERYLAGRGRKDLEIWKPVRQVKRVARGQTLRILSPAPFRLHWSKDDWKNIEDTPSRSSDLGIHFVDIPIDHDQRAPLRFTFLWTASAHYPFFHREADHWEGRDYQVDIT